MNLSKCKDESRAASSAEDFRRKLYSVGTTHGRDKGIERQTYDGPGDWWDHGEQSSLPVDMMIEDP